MSCLGFVDLRYDRDADDEDDNESIPTMDASVAQSSFELNNNIETVDGNDAIYKYDLVSHKAQVDKQPWKKE